MTSAYERQPHGRPLRESCIADDRIASRRNLLEASEGHDGRISEFSSAPDTSGGENPDETAFQQFVGRNTVYDEFGFGPEFFEGFETNNTTPIRHVLYPALGAKCAQGTTCNVAQKLQSYKASYSYSYGPVPSLFINLRDCTGDSCRSASSQNETSEAA